jgi:hypothetical protein
MTHHYHGYKKKLKSKELETVRFLFENKVFILLLLLSCLPLLALFCTVAALKNVMRFLKLSLNLI